jgi:adenylate kinase family enzyme
MIHHIHILGASGSGTTTLGRALGDFQQRIYLFSSTV